jgi:hypothetical protein
MLRGPRLRAANEPSCAELCGDCAVLRRAVLRPCCAVAVPMLVLTLDMLALMLMLMLMLILMLVLMVGWFGSGRLHPC